MMSTKRFAEDQHFDESSWQAVDELELALFLSAVSRDRIVLLSVANSLCLGSQPPPEWNESVWRAALRELDVYLNEWMSDSNKRATLADLATDVPLDSGIFSLGEFRDRLASAISESEAIQTLSNEVELDSLAVAYRDDEYVLLKDGGMTPQLLVSFDRPSTSGELVVTQTIGFRPTSARLRVERDWVIGFDSDGIAKITGENATKLWDRLAQSVMVPAPSEMQHLGPENIMTEEATAGSILNELEATIRANLAEVTRPVEGGIRALIVDLARLVVPIRLSVLSSGREMLFTAQDLVTNIPAAPGCRLDVTVWRQLENNGPWLNLHIELAPVNSRERTRAAVEVILEWDEQEAATKWQLLTANVPLVIDIPEKPGGKLSVVVR